MTSIVLIAMGFGAAAALIVAWPLWMWYADRAEDRARRQFCMGILEMVYGRSRDQRPQIIEAIRRSFEVKDDD